ncbi:aromatic acid exporter family protein [Microbacterium paludicola]|uniref:FUSC family protein n=1 Tax=Microbacterium paludicola TaxID=300019 RepID=UPI001430B870|nr:FUSC family protein [Microbacterium paludicola]MBF0814992.1 FUSC family protein [Microbacterium paludicola]
MTAMRLPLPRLRGLLELSRVVLALRTAVAAAIAWYLAPLVPFAEAEYSYYAPLGVLVSMYPTLARSARSGAQALLGLALGIALGIGGIALTWLGAPGIIALALVVGVGVWLGGIEQLDAGRDWIAMAGLFVLLLGGPTPDDFSISYLVTMAFGVIVGLVANLLFPPLYLQQASARLSSLRDAAAAHLHDMADAVEADQLEKEHLHRIVRELRETETQVAAAVEDADESSRANPRARGRGQDRELNRQRLEALERTTFSIRELADALERAHDRPAGPEPAQDLLAEAIHRVADLVAQAPRSDAGAEQLTAAERALERYTSAIDDAAGGAERVAVPSGVAEEITAAVCLRRIVDASRPLV